jgi:hypothetical protein
MTFLFQDNYKDALDGFGRFLEKSNDGKLYEDASFRKAVCLYGLEKYPEAAQKSGALSGRISRGRADSRGADAPG